MKKPRQIQIPPIALPSLWKISEIGDLSKKAIQAWNKMRYAEASKLCVEMAKRANKASEMLKETSKQFMKLQEGLLKPGEASKVRCREDGWSIDGFTSGK